METLLPWPLHLHADSNKMYHFYGMTLNNRVSTLKDVLTRAPLLAFPDFSLHITICTDASALGIGAVLMQTEESKLPHVIAYASRVRTAAESKYSVTHLEALAVFWALKHFRDIIFGYASTVYTHQTAVTHLFHRKNLTGCLARLYLIIQQFEPTFRYLPDKANTVADTLYPIIPASAVNGIANFSLSELHNTQHQDPIWPKVAYALESGDYSTLQHMSVPLSSFSMKEDVLCLTGTVGKTKVTKLVTPSSLVETTLILLHDAHSASHPGRDKTLSMAHAK